MNDILPAIKRNGAVFGVMGLGVLAVFSAVLLSRSTGVNPTGTKASTALTNTCEVKYSIPQPSVVPCEGSVNVNLILDRSSSMNVNYTDPETGVTKKKIEWEKDAMKQFVKAAREKVLVADRNNPLTVRVSVSSYGAQGNKDGVTDPTEPTRKLGRPYDSLLVSPLKSLNIEDNYNALVAAIDTVVYNSSGDGTCTECGLRIGRQQSVKTVSALVYANLLTADGLSNREWDGTGHFELPDEDPENIANKEAVNEANRNKNVSIDNYVIGYGEGININTTTLKAISKTGAAPFYYQNPKPSDWDDVAITMLDNICRDSSNRAN